VPAGRADLSASAQPIVRIIQKFRTELSAGYVQRIAGRMKKRNTQAVDACIDIAGQYVGTLN